MDFGERKNPNENSVRVLVGGRHGVEGEDGLIEGLLAYSRDTHPKEMILLLRGKVGDEIDVDEVIVPPSAVHGQRLSSFQPHMIPFDLSILGVVHSRHSGTLNPSVYDLNHFYGKIMMIIAYPYQSVKDVAVFDGKGQKVPFTLS